jgi:hypothetical protein
MFEIALGAMNQRLDAALDRAGLALSQIERIRARQPDGITRTPGARARALQCATCGMGGPTSGAPCCAALRPSASASIPGGSVGSVSARAGVLLSRTKCSNPPGVDAWNIRAVALSTRKVCGTRFGRNITSPARSTRVS